MNNPIEVCAGVVTYNPNIEILKRNLETLSPQVKEIFVVDNGSKNVSDVESLLGRLVNARLYPNGDNLGIAQALNRLCGIAGNDGYQWILTMDQDSLCDDAMVENLVNYATDAVGIAAPRIEFRNAGVLIEATGEDKGGDYEEIGACITSGSLTSIAAWKAVGGFDEWYFIDHVDNEFCTHVIQKGYKVIRVKNALLHQRAGDMKYVKLFGKPIMLPYYSSFRNYYICRNTIYYIRKYHRVINLYREIRSFVYSQTIKLLFEKGRWKNIKSSTKGIRDGFRKKIESIDYSLMYTNRIEL